MLHKHYNSSQECWEGLNEFLFLEEEGLKAKGMGSMGNQCISYDNHITIGKAWVDPKFDFGKVLNYTTHKWSHLVGNYVDFNYLDILRIEILKANKNPARTYSFTYHFNNTHANGKDCLLGIIISKRSNDILPTLTFITRATEVTKRLLFDLLLVQRIGEYIYGNKSFGLNLYLPMMYLHMESFCLYNNHKKLKSLVDTPTKYQSRVLNFLDSFITKNPNSFTYESNKRISLNLQRKIMQDPMLAEDLLLLPKPKIQYPTDCITDLQRKNHRKTLLVQ